MCGMTSEEQRRRLVVVVLANFAVIVWFVAGAQPWLLAPFFGILLIGAWLTLRKTP
jgi:hypothetical protein